jgi:FkbM family methyltransferase
MVQKILASLDRALQNSLRLAIEEAVRDGLLQGLNAEASGFVRFLQIGGNDGKLDDPLLKWHSKFPWFGAIVEPVPVYFEKLTKLHSGHGRFKLVNAAVSDNNGELAIHYINPERASKYNAGLAGVASASLQHLVNHGVDSADCIATRVECITPDELISRMGKVEKLELLCIDVEGHELPILKAFPFDRVNVDVIMYEAWHMTVPQHQEIASYLAYHNKRVFIIWQEAIIVNADDNIRIGYLEHLESLFQKL